MAIRAYDASISTVREVRDGDILLRQRHDSNVVERFTVVEYDEIMYYSLATGEQVFYNKDEIKESPEYRYWIES
jgi:hypothetical protein